MLAMNYTICDITNIEGMNPTKKHRMNVKITESDRGLSYKIELEGRNDKTLQINEVFIDEDEIEAYAKMADVPSELIENLPSDADGYRSVFTVMFREAPGPDSIRDRVCLSWKSAVVAANEMIAELK
jgi:hypothetical protein